MSVQVLLEFNTDDFENPPFQVVEDFFNEDGTVPSVGLYAGITALVEELLCNEVSYRGKILEHNDDNGQWFEIIVLVENDITYTLHNRDKF